MMLAAALAGWIAPYEPDATDAEAALQSPSLHHWLGTDIYGRDLLSRIIYAARVDLTVAFGATAMALVIGSAIGAVAGLYRGIVDLVIMRCVELGHGLPRLHPGDGHHRRARQQRRQRPAGAIAITQIPNYLRLIRGEIFRIREMEYADAARVVGNPAWRDHVHPPAAQLPAADHRAGDPGDGICAAHHGGAVLHRPRHPAAAERMGLDDRGGRAIHRHRRMVAVPVSWPRHRADGACPST